MKQNNLSKIIIAGILSIILLQIPNAYFILYPFNMFVTYIHEACHGLTAILTGGKLLRFTMQWDTSGLAFTQGGIRMFIISAGYLGSSLVGALLIMAAFRKGLEKYILSILGIFFLGFTLIYARNLTAITSGIVFATSMFLIIKIKHLATKEFLLGFLAVQCCFQSFQDIINLVILSSTNIRTDAVSMSLEVTKGIIPPIIFAISWAIISLAFFFLAIKFSIPKKKNEYVKYLETKIGMD